VAKYFFLKEALFYFYCPIFIAKSSNHFVENSSLFFCIEKRLENAWSMDFNNNFALVWLKPFNPDERDKCLISKISLKKQEILL